jgi:hypothetical protein
MNYMGFTNVDFITPEYYEKKQPTYREGDNYQNIIPNRQIPKPLQCQTIESYLNTETCSSKTPSFYGLNRPLNETCPPAKTNLIDVGPSEDNCSSVWNNLTKRKSLVNVHKR